MGAGSRFRVVTDSTADVPPQWIERYRISVVPLTVLFGREPFRDRVDLTDAQFFARLKTADRLPTTSAPSPGAFAELYQSLSSECEGIISIHIGGTLSGTTEAARLGAAGLDGFPVHVIDSGSVTMTVGFLAQVAAEAPDLDQALQRVRERLGRQKVLALLDTLRYIELGGRVSRAQAMLGTMLDLKPILSLQEGEIKSVDRVRTRGKALMRLLQLLRQDLPIERLAVMHAQAPADAERLREELARELPEVEVVIGQIGCVLGTHTGPGAVGFAYLTA
ncbi:MAG: DegV family protein [Candidatus Dormibacteraeota bacterium]|nr:DegV family protein [Candidatus Dormibacteraeota bacterium]